MWLTGRLIDGDNRFSEQVQPAAQRDELHADRADRGAVLAAEFGDSFEIRHTRTRAPPGNRYVSGIDRIILLPSDNIAVEMSCTINKKDRIYLEVKVVM